MDVEMETLEDTRHECIYPYVDVIFAEPTTHDESDPLRIVSI
jgi:hypothetical protein